MKQNDVRRENALSVLSSIRKGNDTSAKISDDTKISLVTISEVTKYLLELDLITSHSEKENTLGRRSARFTLSDKYHCMYIEEKSNSFSIISISPNGHVIVRFESIKKKNRTLCENFQHLLSNLEDIKGLKDCTRVFIVCGDEYTEYLPENFIKTTPEEIIAPVLSTKDEIVLYRLNNRFILSVYGHTKIPDCDKETIDKVICPDRYEDRNDDYYAPLFDALQEIAADDLLHYIR